MSEKLKTAIVGLGKVADLHSSALIKLNLYERKIKNCNCRLGKGS